MMVIGLAWIIWFAIAVHAVWAVCLFVSSDPIQTTAISGLYRWGLHKDAVALVLAVVAGSALWSMLCKNRGRTVGRLVELLPQQLILTLSAFSALDCMIDSSFADGVIRPRAFIVADQCPILFMATAHTFAIIDMFSGEWLKTLWLNKLSRWRLS